MYEIKSHNGRVLYVAKNATDIRSALEDAVAAGADLARANLVGADLAEVNLARANLSRASLERASLAEANLAGANLVRANLVGADLARANLVGADLDGANLIRASLVGANLIGAKLARASLAGASLAGASLAGVDLAEVNLARANLTGAYLTRATWRKVGTILRAATTTMGDGGRHWIQHTEAKRLSDGTTAYCSTGAINKAQNASTEHTIALWLLSSVCAGDIVAFNDYSGTTWEDVRAVFAIAIKHAERFAAFEARV